MVSIINIVFYGIFLIATMFIWKVEVRDNQCSDIWNDGAICGPGHGLPGRGSTPHENDTKAELLDKIKKGSDAESSTIKWRRSFILSSGIAFAFWMLVGTPGTLPEWYRFALTHMIAFTILMFSFAYYSYHIYDPITKNIRESVKLLKKKY